MNNDPTTTEILRKENADLKEEIAGANLILGEIEKMVGDHGQYRDLIESVELKLKSEYKRGYMMGRVSCGRLNP